MKEVSRLFRTHCSSKDTCWTNYVDKIQIWLNIGINSSMGYSPFEFPFGTPPNDLIREIIQFPSDFPTPRQIQLENARQK